MMVEGLDSGGKCDVDDVGMGDMDELTRSTDPIRLSFLTQLLTEAGIEVVLLDQHTSQMFFGSLHGLEQRLMVPGDDLARARRLMGEADAELSSGLSVGLAAGDTADGG